MFSLGANLGDRLATLQGAVDLLAATPLLRGIQPMRWCPAGAWFSSYCSPRPHEPSGEYLTALSIRFVSTWRQPAGITANQGQGRRHPGE